MSKPTGILIACLLSLACSDDGDGGSAIDRVEGFCREWAIRACNEDVTDRCVSGPEECHDAQAAFCESIVPAGKYSSDSAKGCLEAVERAYADAELDPDELSLVRELGGACQAILSGDAGPGEACTADSDCSREAGLSCVVRGDGTSGTCQEAEEVGGGLECVADNIVCADGFYCDGSNCIAEKGEGASCVEAPCAPEFNCELPEGGATGDEVCVARGETGDACENATDCVSGICAMTASGGQCIDAVILAPTEPICDDLG